MDKFTKQLLGTKTQQDVTPNGFNQPRSRFYNSTIRNYWEQGGALAPIIPHLYESKGTPIYRDTTDSSLFENGGELLAQPYPNSFFASDLGNYYADGGPLHDRDNTTGKLLNSTYASVLGNMFRDGGYFDRGYSLPEDSFRQGGRGLKDSIYASTSGQYPATYRQGGSILSMSNTPQLEGEGKDLNYPSKGYAYGSGGMLKRADGSYSKKGLWDYIRANKGSGKEPTKEMLRQESKIRNEKAFGGVITTSQLPQANYFDNGGKPKNPKLITYKTDSKLIDGTAAFDLISKVPISDDYNQQIKERLYTGKWGFDPESGALVKLNKSQQTTIPQNITNIRKEEKEDQEYRAAIQRGEINPRIDTPIIPQANRQMTPQEVKEFVRQGYDAAILNPAFETVAYFTPPGMAIGAIQGAANLIPDLYEGDYGYAAMDAASILPFARPITQKAKSAIQNTYKINPWAVKENPEMFLYRAEPKNFNTQSTVDFMKQEIAAGREKPWYKGVIKSYEEGHPKLVAQNDFHGQWFEKDPSRLDFYLNSGDKYDADTHMNIFRKKIPTAQAKEFSVLNNEKANVISASPNTEFVLPRNMVESAEIFPQSSWQDLIQQDKTFNTPHWLKGYKEVPKPGTKNVIKAGSGGIDMSRYEIANPDYFTQLLDTYTSRQLPPSSKKFYKGLIESVKKQDGIVTERQYQELQRLKTGNFNYGKKAYQEGGKMYNAPVLTTSMLLNRFK
jgi:hypothetical protein